MDANIYFVAQAWMLLSIFTLFTGSESVAAKIVHQWKVDRQISASISIQVCNLKFNIGNNYVNLKLLLKRGIQNLL